MIFVIDATAAIPEMIPEKDVTSICWEKRAALKAFIFGKDTVVADFG